MPDVPGTALRRLAVTQPAHSVAPTRDIKPFHCASWRTLLNLNRQARAAIAQPTVNARPGTTAARKRNETALRSAGNSTAAPMRGNHRTWGTGFRKNEYASLPTMHLNPGGRARAVAAKVLANE